ADELTGLRRGLAVGDRAVRRRVARERVVHLRAGPGGTDPAVERRAKGGEVPVAQGRSREIERHGAVLTLAESREVEEEERLVLPDRPAQVGPELVAVEGCSGLSGGVQRERVCRQLGVLVVFVG